MNREELAWAAGLFDGEGHVRTTFVQNKYPVLRVEIAQKDRRVLDRFHKAVGCLGKIYMINRKAPKNPYFNLHTGKFEHAQAIIALLWTWLSPIKREQAKNAIKAFHVGLEAYR